MGAKSLCIPFEQPEGIEKGVTKCVNPHCTRFAEKWCMFGHKFKHCPSHFMSKNTDEKVASGSY
jgi:hypothetical protein